MIKNESGATDYKWESNQWKAKLMMELTSQMKNIQNIEPVITIRTRPNEETEKNFSELASKMI